MPGGGGDRKWLVNHVPDLPIPVIATDTASETRRYVGDATWTALPKRKVDKSTAAGGPARGRRAPMAGAPRLVNVLSALAWRLVAAPLRSD
jgi:hypothetical protein